jgi:RNA polymerase sigma factor (TIGR02999 family)
LRFSFSNLNNVRETPVQETTRLLRNWARGDQEALVQLLPRVYRELRRIAAHALRNERAGYTMQATELVHEAYLRLVDVNQLDWKDRAHFLGVAATTMRRVLLDRARRRLRAKRKAHRVPLNLDETLHLSSNQSRELVALDDALQTLAQLDPRKARVVELRFFGGMDVTETAQIVGVSPETVMRDWKMARSWLLMQLDPHP